MANSDYIATERERLQSEVKNIDERLEDFKELLHKSVNRNADYSIDTLKYVELLLMHIKPNFEADADLLAEAALYIGETIRRAYNGQWDIEDDRENNPDYYGQPVIRINSIHEDFYPFIEIKEFIAHPSVGYFENILKEQ